MGALLSMEQGAKAPSIPANPRNLEGGPNTNPTNVAVNVNPNVHKNNVPKKNAPKNNATAQGATAQGATAPSIAANTNPTNIKSNAPKKTPKNNATAQGATAPSIEAPEQNLEGGPNTTHVVVDVAEENPIEVVVASNNVSEVPSPVANASNHNVTVKGGRRRKHRKSRKSRRKNRKSLNRKRK